jgi:uncharacterized membrane protein
VKLVQEALATATSDLKQKVRGALRSLVFALVAGAVLLLGLIFLLVGAYQSMAENMPAWQAGAVIALAALVVAALLVLLSRVGRGRRRERARVLVRDEEIRVQRDQIDQVVAAELGASVWELLKRRRPRALEMTVASFVAGLLMSRRERRRTDDGDSRRS